MSGVSYGIYSLQNSVHLLGARSFLKKAADGLPRSNLTDRSISQIDDCVSFVLVLHRPARLPSLWRRRRLGASRRLSERR